MVFVTVASVASVASLVTDFVGEPGGIVYERLRQQYLIQMIQNPSKILQQLAIGHLLPFRVHYMLYAHVSFERVHR